MKPLKRVLAVCMALFFSASLFNCGSPDDTVFTDDGNDTTSTDEITLQKENYNAFEVALVKSNDLFQNQTYIGYLDTLAIDLIYVSARELAFSVPNIASGGYNFEVEGFDGQFYFEVTEAQEIAQPIESITQFIGDYEADIDAIISHTYHLDSLGLIEDINAELAVLQNAKDSLRNSIQRVNELTESEQQVLAQYIAANSENLNEFNRILDNVYEDGSFKKGNCDFAEDWGKATCFIREMTIGIIYMGAPAAIGGIIGAELSAGLGTVVGAVIFTGIFKSKVLAGRTRFRNALIEMANWAFIPVDNVTADLETFKKELVFQSNIPKKVNFSFQTRTINKSKDQGSSELGSMFTMVDAFNYINKEVLKMSTFAIPPEKTAKYIPNELGSVEFQLIGNDKVDGILEIDGDELRLNLVTEEPDTQLVELKMLMVYGDRTIESGKTPVKVVIPNFELEGNWLWQGINSEDGTVYLQRKMTIDENGRMISGLVNEPARGTEWESTTDSFELEFAGYLYFKLKREWNTSFNRYPFDVEDVDATLFKSQCVYENDINCARLLRQ